MSPFFNLHTSNPLIADSLLIAPPFVSISVGLYCPLYPLLGTHFSFSSFRDDLSALPLPLSFHFLSLLYLYVHFHIFLSRFLLFPSSSFFSFSSHPSPNPPRSLLILRFTFTLLSLLLRAFMMHLVLPSLAFSSHLLLFLFQFAFTSAVIHSSRLQRYAFSCSNDMQFLPTHRIRCLGSALVFFLFLFPCTPFCRRMYSPSLVRVSRSIQDSVERASPSRF